MRYCHAYNEEFSKYRKSHNFSFFNNLFFVPFVFVFVFVFFVLFLCGSRGPESSMRLKKLLWIVLLIFRLDLIVVKMSYLVDDVSWSFYLKGSYMLQLYLFVKIFSIQYSVFTYSWATNLSTFRLFLAIWISEPLSSNACASVSVKMPL